MNKALEGAAMMIFLAIVGVVLAAAWLVYRLVERTIQTVDRTWGATFYQIGAGGVMLAFLLLVIGGAVVLVSWLARRSRQIGARDGLYPRMDHGRGRYADLNEPGAQSLAVLAAGRRPTAALAGRVIDAQYRTAPDPAALPEPEAQPLTVQAVTAINPRTAPHWLLVGTTGSGKTSASYAILSELARRAACEFVITEPGGVNWGAQTTATTTPEIARAILGVQREMERRQGLLREYDVDHVQDLAEPLPYLVLVAEETDAVLDDLRLTDRETRTAAIIALRAIARMGRKAGVCLMAVSQSGTTDVFDSHVRKNLSNVLLFRSEHTVSETWRAGVKLSDLPPGAAYSVRHAAFVQFPHLARPQLPQPALSDGGILVDNWPTTVPVAAVAPVVGGSGPIVERLQPGREPDAQLAAQLRSLHAAGWSKTSLCNAAWGYKDGAVWQILDRVLGGEL
jgi:hypothetical protein